LRVPGPEGRSKRATQVVSRLEAKGLAHRRFAPGNAGHQTLVLSASGRARVPLLAALADERQVLMSAMRALVQRHPLKDIPIA